MKTTMKRLAIISLNAAFLAAAFFLVKWAGF